MTLPRLPPGGTPLRESMVDVQSPQQALRSYSSAKEYAWGILCDARPEDSNSEASPERAPYERGTSVCPESPHGPRRVRCTPKPLAPNGEYPSRSPTPSCDESRLGNNPISTLGHLKASGDLPQRMRHPNNSGVSMEPGYKPVSPVNRSPAASSSSAAAAVCHCSARTQARLRCRWTSASQVKPIPPCT